MAKETPKDPWTALGEMLAPAITALTEYFRLLAAMTPLVKRIADAQKADEGLELSPEDVRVLCLLLNNLSETKKR